jgi:hypothetical protein
MDFSTSSTRSARQSWTHYRFYILYKFLAQFGFVEHIFHH